MLFRDLDETLYLSGCPGLEDLAEREKRFEAADRQPAQDHDGEAEPESQNASEPDDTDCFDVEAGRTFSAEVQGQDLKIVIRGRQLPFTIFGMRPKLRSISSPYEPTPSGTKPSIVPKEMAEAMGTPPESQPEWYPPKVDDFSTSSPSLGAGAGVPLAKTSLRTGRFAIECSNGRAQVYVDQAYMGMCPLEMPLAAGPHVVSVKREGKPDWIREFRMAAGETVRLKADLSGTPEER